MGVFKSLQIERWVAESIRQYGFLVSLVISKEYKIIADDLEVQGRFSCFMVLDLDT